MQEEDILFFKSWFAQYCKGFYNDDLQDIQNIKLKDEHTHRVCINGVKIAEGLHMDDSDVFLAKTVCLFHDVARFEQYKKYKTFKDSESVNHGVLGASILFESGILNSLSLKEQNIILQSVKYHNAFSLPHIEDEQILRFLRLVRDADKLDIWHIFYHYYIKGASSMPSAMGLGLPDTEGYSDVLIDTLLSHKLAKLSDVKNLNDFKLLKLSWIYDINYTTTFNMIKQDNYIDMIMQTLPQDKVILDLRLDLLSYVEFKLSCQ